MPCNKTLLLSIWTNTSIKFTKNVKSNSPKMSMVVKYSMSSIEPLWSFHVTMIHLRIRFKRILFSKYFDVIVLKFNLFICFVRFCFEFILSKKAAVLNTFMNYKVLCVFDSLKLYNKLSLWMQTMDNWVTKYLNAAHLLLLLTALFTLVHRLSFISFKQHYSIHQNPTNSLCNIRFVSHNFDTNRKQVVIPS